MRTKLTLYLVLHLINERKSIAAVDAPLANGMCTSRTRTKSEAYALSDASSSCRACCLFVVGRGGSDECSAVEEDGEPIVLVTLKLRFCTSACLIVGL